MIEEAMNEEMAPEEPMTGMAAPEADMPMEESPEMKYDMETLVSNYTSMEEGDRKKLLSVVASPVTGLVDTLLGEPVLERFSMQIEKEIPMGEEQPMEEAPMGAPAEGIMGAPEGTEEEPAPLV